MAKKKWRTYRSDCWKQIFFTRAAKKLCAILDPQANFGAIQISAWLQGKGRWSWSSVADGFSVAGVLAIKFGDAKHLRWENEFPLYPLVPKIWKQPTGKHQEVRPAISKLALEKSLVVRVPTSVCDLDHQIWPLARVCPFLGRYKDLLWSVHIFLTIGTTPSVTGTPILEILISAVQLSLWPTVMPPSWRATATVSLFTTLA